MIWHKELQFLVSIVGVTGRHLDLQHLQAKIRYLKNGTLCFLRPTGLKIDQTNKYVMGK